MSSVRYPAIRWNKTLVVLSTALLVLWPACTQEGSSGTETATTQGAVAATAVEASAAAPTQAVVPQSTVAATPTQVTAAPMVPSQALVPNWPGQGQPGVTVIPGNAAAPVVSDLQAAQAAFGAALAQQGAVLEQNLNQQLNLAQQSVQLANQDLAQLGQTLNAAAQVANLQMAQGVQQMDRVANLVGTGLTAAGQQLDAAAVALNANLQAASAQIGAAAAQLEVQLQAATTQGEAATQAAFAQIQAALEGVAAGTALDMAYVFAQDTQAPMGQAYDFEDAVIRSSQATAPSIPVAVEAVQPSVPSVEPALSADSIRNTVRANDGQVRECYVQSLTANPALQGRMVLSFSIGTEGEVLAPYVAESTMSYPPMDFCVLNQVSQWRFERPQPPGQVTVNYPFLFQAN